MATNFQPISSGSSGYSNQDKTYQNIMALGFPLGHQSPGSTWTRAAKHRAPGNAGWEDLVNFGKTNRVIPWEWEGIGIQAATAIRYEIAI